MYITEQGGYSSLASVPGGEAIKMIVTTTDPTGSPADLVNGSAQGLGVDNQWVGDNVDRNALLIARPTQ